MSKMGEKGLSSMVPGLPLMNTSLFQSSFWALINCIL